VNTWFNDDVNVSAELRDRVVHATLPNLNNTLDGDGYNARNADLTALSQPVAGSTNGLPFFLSPADLNVRLGNSSTARRALAINGTTQMFYWLRSAGGNTSNTISIVNFSGNWNTTLANSVNNSLGVRPAIWVRR
jgi:hypothetical protein